MGDYVYFASGSSLGVGRVSKSGGSITQYTTDREGTSVTTDDALRLIWIAGCCVVRKTKANEGGDVLAGLSTGLAVGHRAGCCTNIYFATSIGPARYGAFRRREARQHLLAVFSNQGPTAVAVLWRHGLRRLDRAFRWRRTRVATDGTALTWIAHLDGSSSVVADATSVYWTSQGSPGSVRPKPPTMGLRSSCTAPAVCPAASPSTTSTCIGPTTLASSGLRRARLPSLRSTKGTSQAVAVDDQCVYYTMDCCEFTSGPDPPAHEVSVTAPFGQVTRRRGARPSSSRGIAR